MKILIAVVALLISGCLATMDTRILSRKIARSTATQEKAIEEHLNGLSIEEATEIMQRAQALSISTEKLADILQAPKELPEDKK